jgi:hypothetical protein
MVLDYVSGIITMGYIVAGLFFFRFWRRTADNLFLIFGAAFWLMALSQAIVTLAGIPREDLSWVYLLRLAAFCLIIAAIVFKNMEAKRK